MNTQRAAFRLAGIGLAVLLAGYAWQRDEPLDPEVESWLAQQPPTAAESLAFLYVLGLDAPADRDPEDYGRIRRDDYTRWCATTPSGADGYRSPALPVLPLPKSPVICFGEEQDDCFEHAIADPAGADTLVRANPVLLDRYRRVLAMDAYRTNIEPSLNEPMLPLKALVIGQQIFHLDLLGRARAGQGVPVHRELNTELELLRAWLVRSDAFMLKIAAVSLVNRNLELQARLFRRGWIPPPEVPAPLTEAERSFEQPMRRRVRELEVFYRSELPPGSVSTMGRFAWRFVFKPNMTLNAEFPVYLQVAELSRLPPAAFAVEVAVRPPVMPMPTGARNSYGDLLLTVAGMDYRLYASRIQDLDAKMKLLNVLPEFPADPAAVTTAIAASSIDNPYYPGQAPGIDATGWVCFDGPFEDRRHRRCLPLR